MPRLWNSPWTNWPALWPIDTIVVTAAMPITTPSTVKPARILFLASARKAIRKVINKSKSVLPVFANKGVPVREILLGRGLGSGNYHLAVRDFPRDYLAALAVIDAAHDCDGPQKLAILNPDVPVVALAIGSRLL